MGIQDIGQLLKNKNIKRKIKKLIIKYVLPVVLGLLLLILLAGAFMIITEKIKEVSGRVVETVSSVFGKIFDNTQDLPTVTIDDKLIEEIKKQLTDSAIDINATYLTDDLLKKSLGAYYATQYPYIEGADYTEDTVKGCIYLKRGTSNGYMKYINYNSFKEKLGEGKSANDVSNIKNCFSMDDDQNIVVATWSESTEVTECIEDGYQQKGSNQNGYKISEYKIDQKSLTAQYAINYKLPILLANLYSNEGFGIAVADLGINSKIELTVLDSTTKTETTTKEYYNMNYKASGTYSWRHFEDDPLTTENFQDLEWNDNHTTEDKVYKITTKTTEENSVTLKPTLLDTWVVKGEITDIEENIDTPPPSENTTYMENTPKDYTADPNISITEEQRAEIIKQILETRDRRYNR